MAVLSKYTDAPSDQAIQLKQLVIHLKSELARYKERVKELESNSGIHEILDENRYLLKELESAHEAARAAEEREEHFKREIQKLENKNQLLIVEMETLRQQLSQSEKETENLDDLREELEEKNHELYHAIKREITDELDEKMERLKNTLSSLFEQAVPQTGELYNAMAEARAEWNQLAQSLFDRQQSMVKEQIRAQLKEILSPLQETVEKLAEQMVLYAKQSEEEKARAEHLQTNFRQMEEILLPLRSNLEEIGNELNVLKNRQSGLNEETIRSEVSAALSSFKTNMEKLAEQMAVFSKHSEEQRTKTELLQTHFGQLTEMLGFFRHNIEELGNGIRELKNRQSFLDDELTRLKTANEKYHELEKEWRKEIDDMLQLLGGISGQKGSEPADEENDAQSGKNELLTQFRHLKTQLKTEIEHLKKAAADDSVPIKKNPNSNKAAAKRSGHMKASDGKSMQVQMARTGICSEQPKSSKQQAGRRIKTNESETGAPAQKTTVPNSKQTGKTVSSFRFSRPEASDDQSHFKHSLPAGKVISINLKQQAKSREKTGYMKTPENNKKHSLSIFYEKNPLYNHPDIQQYSINPFNKSL